MSDQQNNHSLADRLLRDPLLLADFQHTLAHLKDVALKNVAEQEQSGKLKPTNLEAAYGGQDTSEHPVQRVYGTPQEVQALEARRPTRQGRGARNAPRHTAEKERTMTTPTMTNKISFADMLQVANDLGQQAAQGVDVQIKMDLKVLEAAFHGSLDLDANKHGAQIDDATKLSEAYWRARNGTAVFDTKAGNQRKLISTTRKAIKLGQWSKGGPGEPLQTVNNLISLRQRLRKDPAVCKKLDDAHNTFMRFATQQLKRDHTIPDAELQSFCFRPAKDEQTLEDFYEATRKRFQKVKDGKLGHNLQDSDPAVQNIIRECTKRLTAIAKAKAPQSGMATASGTSTTSP